MVNPNMRRTMAPGRQTMRVSRQGAVGRTSFLREKGGRKSFEDVQIPKFIAEQPSCLRFVELIFAVVLWVAVFALLLLFKHQLVATVFIVFVMICLLLHSQLLRPYCYEFDEEEDTFFEANLTDDAPIAESNQRRMFGAELGQQFWEEWKLVCLCVIIMSSIGCVVCWTVGGSLAFQTWIAHKHTPCIVADLQEVQQNGINKFGCQDGYVDVETSVSFMKQSGVMMPSYHTYRMAPVYSGSSKGGGAPVAWAVSKDFHITPLRSKSGLSGIFVSLDEDPSTCHSLLCPSQEDQSAYVELRSLLQGSVKDGGAAKFDAGKIPAVLLTDLMNPIGKAFHFLFGAACYVVVFVGLCCVQTSMIMEHRRSAEKKLAEEAQYDLLNEND